MNGSIQPRLDRLELAIRELQIEFEKFFNGARATPPLDLRDEVQAEVRRLRNTNLHSVADSFRFAQVEARFTSLGEMFNRRLRLQEEGRGPAAPAVVARTRLDPRRGVVLADRVETAAVEALYEGLARSGQRPGFDLESFRLYLEKQVTSIRQRTGCHAVRFRLEPDGERLKLKAKPLTG
ncbi:MAG TPA: hypothetical protein VHQ65_03180 [Thermoanaerobaculia bacterium]|nr:hypothetical protein [Thermoanaerobaculia bacterium]